MKPTLVLYTHTDMADVWPIFFGQVSKYMWQYRKIVYVDRYTDLIPLDYEKIIYDDRLSYRKRMLFSLARTNDLVILFQHEDMFLYDAPMLSVVEDMADALMHPGGPAFMRLVPVDEDVERKYGFTVQPAIWPRQRLYKLLDQSRGESIWDLETKSRRAFHRLAYNSISIQKGEKRGKYHYDSPMFPACATAITKGRWNTKEYGKELAELFFKYKIDPNERGTND